MTEKRRKRGASKLNNDIPDLAFDPIAAALKQLHNEIASEAIPDDFLSLLDRLDQAEDTKDGSKRQDS